MTRMTSTDRFTAGSKPILALSENAYHSREGNALHKWVNDALNLSTASILPTAGLCYDLNEGEQVFITNVCWGLHTASDSVIVEVVSTTGACGTGVATLASHHFEGATGATPTGKELQCYPIDPPIMVRYSDGARSVSLKADANDDAASVTMAWYGWVEDEG